MMWTIGQQGVGNDVNSVTQCHTILREMPGEGGHSPEPGGSHQQASPDMVCYGLSTRTA